MSQTLGSGRGQWGVRGGKGGGLWGTMHAPERPGTPRIPRFSTAPTPPLDSRASACGPHRTGLFGALSAPSSGRKATYGVRIEQPVRDAGRRPPHHPPHPTRPPFASSPSLSGAAEAAVRGLHTAHTKPRAVRALAAPILGGGRHRMGSASAQVGPGRPRAPPHRPRPSTRPAAAAAQRKRG